MVLVTAKGTEKKETILARGRKFRAGFGQWLTGTRGRHYLRHSQLALLQRHGCAQVALEGRRGASKFN